MIGCQVTSLSICLSLLSSEVQRLFPYSGLLMEYSRSQGLAQCPVSTSRRFYTKKISGIHSTLAIFYRPLSRCQLSGGSLGCLSKKRAHEPFGHASPAERPRTPRYHLSNSPHPSAWCLVRAGRDPPSLRPSFASYHFCVCVPHTRSASLHASAPCTWEVPLPPSPNSRHRIHGDAVRAPGAPSGPVQGPVQGPGGEQ